MTGMTDPSQTPGRGGNSGEWQPVPGGGDYDPDQTMHVSFAAQLPPQPRPGEDPLGAHGPAGTPDAATAWSIPVIRDEGDRADAEGDSGEYPVGAFGAAWDQAPSPAAPTQSFPAGMFGQGAAAVAAAAQVRAAEAESAAQAGGEPEGGWNAFSEFPDPVPWQPVDPAAAEAAWSAAADPVPDPALPPQEAEPGAGPGEPAGYAPEPLPEAEAAGDAGAAGDAEPAVQPEPLPEAVATDADAADATGSEGADDDGTEPVDAADSDAEAEPEDGYGDEDEPPAEETHSEHPLASYVLRVNGADRPVTDAWLGESLLYVLRERLGLAGAKDGCEQGECGACSVQVDGRLVASCLVPAATAAGSEVRTVEGLSGEGGPCAIQRALADCGAVQCGFCIPGMAMTVHDLLEGNHRPTDLETRQALSGNLCRCTGYRGVVEAVRQVVAARDGEDPPPAASRIPAQSGPSSPEAAV